MALKAEDVRKALRNKYSDSRRYAVAEEVGLQTGYSHRRLDMMVLDCYASNGFRIDGIEIKVSKADLKRELEDPEKHVAFFDVIDYFTLACPKGIADLDIIPKKWGVLQISDDLSTRFLRRPIALHDEVERKVPRGFLASIVRAIQGRQPANKELQDEYERGCKDTEESMKRHLDYQQRHVSENYQKIKNYEDLCWKLQLFSDDPLGQLDQDLKAFNAFQDLGKKWMSGSIDRTIADLKKINAYLQGEFDGEE